MVNLPEVRHGMVRIPGGPFWMGTNSRDSEPDERPLHRREVSTFDIDISPPSYNHYKAHLMRIQKTPFVLMQSLPDGSITIHAWSDDPKSLEIYRKKNLKPEKPVINPNWEKWKDWGRDGLV